MDENPSEGPAPLGADQFPSDPRVVGERQRVHLRLDVGAFPVEAGRPSSDGRRSWFHRHATVARSRMLPARVCDRGAFAAGLREPPPSDRPIVAYLGLVIACGRITGEYRPYDRRSEWEAVPHVLCSRHGNLVFIPRDERSICCRHLDLPSDGSQYASRPGIIGT